MRVALLVAVAVVVGAGALAALMPAGTAPVVPATARVAAGGKRIECTAVEHIVDGDTLDASCGGESQRVRLLRINTPERGRPGYREASEALAAIVGQGPIALEFEQDAVQRDAFGRMLAYVYRGERLANLEMVRQGWSAFFKKYGEGRLVHEFGHAEHEARVAHAGLWDAKHFAPPVSGEPGRAKSGTPKAQAPAAPTSCRDPASCCRVCRTSQACGDGCIGIWGHCTQPPGCACKAADLCP